MKTISCPGCGLILPSENLAASDRFNAPGECWKQYHSLAFYTLAKQDSNFIHQLAVDTYSAQHAGGITKNITVSFALIGLYLYLEKGFTGREVQHAHVELSNKKYDWPKLEAPKTKATYTVLNVVEVADEHKDKMLEEWARAVWDSWEVEKGFVRGLYNSLV